MFGTYFYNKNIRNLTFDKLNNIAKNNKIMAKLNVSTIGIIIILIVVAGGIYLSFTGSIPEIRQEEQKEESIAQPEIKSIAGRVISINIDENSFVVLQPKEEREFTVKLGEGTEFIRLVFPFDLTISINSN